MIPAETVTKLSVLNCLMGDLKVSFDEAKPEEVANARAMITDLLRKGFLIFIETPEGTVRATGFDEKTNEYLVKSPEPKMKGRLGRLVKRIKAAGAKTTAVARTGGG